MFPVRDTREGNDCPGGFPGYQENESDSFAEMLTCEYKILSVLEGGRREIDKCRVPSR